MKAAPPGWQPRLSPERLHSLFFYIDFVSRSFSVFVYCFPYFFSGVFRVFSVKDHVVCRK